jgi:predicted NBD/HSP70 family sugar kinase
MTLRGPATQLVFTTLLTQGALSRIEIVRRTGLSSAAVSKAVRPLLDVGYLVDTTEEQPERGIGRPASPVTVRAEHAFFVGVKVTGTELIGAVTNLRAQTQVTRHRQLGAHDVSHVINAISQLVGELLGESAELQERCQHLAISISGDVDPQTGVVRYSPFLDWHQIPLAHLATVATGLHTVVENDVRALTVAEHWFGSGVGARSFALVTVGTGVGCGIVVDDAVIAGAHGVAGEIGHLPIESGGPRCRCGNRGCVESIASDQAITDQICVLGGHTMLTTEEAIALGRRGDPTARAVYARAGRALGLALAAVANLVGPERIVISGEGLAAYDLYEQHVRSSFAGQAFGAAGDCELIIRPLPFEEWARGAAAVAIRRLINSGDK